MQPNNGGSFYKILTNGFEEKVTVPCCIRESINRLVGIGNAIVLHTPCGTEYRVSVKKRRHKTTIQGEQWTLFLDNYTMRVGEVVLFTHTGDGYNFNVIPFNTEGVQKSRNCIPALHSIPEGMQELLNSCIFSDGVKLTVPEQQLLCEKLASLGQQDINPIVHKLTPTNIDQSRLNVPRRVLATRLNPGSRGTIFLTYHGVAGSTEANFKCSLDGRLSIKKGWGDFAATHGLKVDTKMLITFNVNESMVYANFDVISIFK